MSRPFLTVLTTPVPTTPECLYRGVRSAARRILKPGLPPPRPRAYPGHEALVRSAVQGLHAIGADFNFNPGRAAALGDAVYAPANEALRQAFEWKRTGTVTTLVAGPVNAFLPSEGDGLLLKPEIDVVIVASPWVRDLYAVESPELTHKVRIAQAGIDPEYWRPPLTPRSSKAVVYWKSGDAAFCGDVERVVAKAGLEPVRITYGDYSVDTYKRLLSDARVVVFLSSFETQGLALAEAWAMDVPALVWNPRALTQWRGRSFVAGSSCPFLTPVTGIAWQTVAELEAALEQVSEGSLGFEPRQWVLNHMTDAICAATLYRIIQDAARR